MARNTGRGSVSWRERFTYWFDNHMARGSLGLIRALIIASLIFAIFMAGVIILLGFSEEGETVSVVWDSIATVINAWMPYYEDGGVGYLLLMTVTAVAGVLFTSVLIGIVTSAIEERIIDLKKGNSLVIERGHTVVLGFYPGEYTLLRQLILAAAGKPDCVVLAEDMDRDEMEQYIRENIEAPRNFRIICRTVDITDPASIEKCSVGTARAVIIHPTDDARTVKALLAVSSLRQDGGQPGCGVSAIISKNEHGFPPSIAEKNNISALQANDTLARMIAHSCTQRGLSETFQEVFNFDGSEFYLVSIPEAAGLTFADLTLRLDLAVPLGVRRDGRIRLNPPAELLLQEGDGVLVFTDDDTAFRLTAPVLSSAAAQPGEDAPVSEAETNTVILGYNDTLPIVLQELPENVSSVVLAGKRGSEDDRRLADETAAARGLGIRYYDGELSRGDALLEIARMAEHIVILNDHELDDEEADMEAIYLLLNLRDLRTRYGFRYNITAEMRRERNQNLAASDDLTDFVVASSMSSLLLAQLAEHPELHDAFSEILSNEGNELYLKSADSLRCTGAHTVRELREEALRRGYVLLGYANAAHESTFNPPLDSVVELTPECSLIVLGLR